MNHQPTPQLVIRISDNSLLFAFNSGGSEGVTFESYEVKSGISMAANLREAFKTSALLRSAGMRATVLLDSPTMLIPLDEFQAEEAEQQYRFVFPASEGMSVEGAVLPAFRDMALFAVSKDVKTVLLDHFEEVKMYPVMLKVWDFFLHRSQGGSNRKLYSYFHDGKMELCAFNRNRFSFVNVFEVTDMHDAMYFLLGVWKQLGYLAMTDDIYLSGKLPSREAFTDETRAFLQRVYYINPSADFNRAPVTQILNMPLDMMLQFL